MAKKLLVIGVGPGGENGLTRHAQEAILSANRVYAASRHAHLVSPEKLRALEPMGTVIDSIRADMELEGDVAVLVSGDTGLYSMLPMLVRSFGRERLRVIPGVSAMQVLCARLGEAWQDARILSAHGRTLSEGALAEEVRTHATTILFCDAEHGPLWIADVLYRAGVFETELAVGERLDYPDERITRGTISEIVQNNFDPLCMVRIRNPHPEPVAREIGLADDTFIRGKTPMTKKEVRALAIAFLKLDRDSVVWDVGAGTGSVSIECARQCPYGHVFAVERDAEALTLLRQNVEKFHLLNVEIVSGAAPGALNDLQTPTHVFLGGSGGDMPEILHTVENRGVSVRLVATAVTMESAWVLLDQTRQWKNVELTQIAVNRLESVGKYHMFKAQNPVFLLCADWKGKSE